MNGCVIAGYFSPDATQTQKRPKLGPRRDVLERGIKVFLGIGSRNDLTLQNKLNDLPILFRSSLPNLSSFGWRPPH